MSVKYNVFNILILLIVFSTLPNLLFAGIESINTRILLDENELRSAYVSDSISNHNNADSLSEATIDTTIIYPIDGSDSVYIENTTPVEKQKNADIQTELLIPKLKTKAEISDTVFDFNLTTDIHYKIINQFRTSEGKEFFIKGWECNEKLNQLLIQIDNRRNQYMKTSSSSGREKISNEVMELESQQIELKANCDNYFMNARELEQKFWIGASEEEMQKINTENDSITKVEIEKLLPKPEIITIEVETDSTALLAADSISMDDPNIKSPVNEPNTNNIVYKIQIGSFSNGLPSYAEKLFKKLSVLRKIDHHIDEKGVTVYTIGEVSSVADAAKLQNQIRQEGVKDAFVIAIFNGKRITLKEAKELGGK